MAAGSVPAAILGVFRCTRSCPASASTSNDRAAEPDRHHPGARRRHRRRCARSSAFPACGMPRTCPPTARSDRHTRCWRSCIGVVFGFILGLTSVGSGVFFGMALVTLFPLAARRVVGTDLFHAMLVTVAAGLATIVWGAPQLQRRRLDPDRLDPRHPDRLALHRRAPDRAAARHHRAGAGGIRPEDAGRGPDRLRGRRRGHRRRGRLLRSADAQPLRLPADRSRRKLVDRDRGGSRRRLQSARREPLTRRDRACCSS